MKYRFAPKFAGCQFEIWNETVATSVVSWVCTIKILYPQRNRRNFGGLVGEIRLGDGESPQEFGTLSDRRGF